MLLISLTLKIFIYHFFFVSFTLRKNTDILTKLTSCKHFLSKISNFLLIPKVRNVYNANLCYLYFAIYKKRRDKNTSFDYTYIYDDMMI